MEKMNLFKDSKELKIKINRSVQANIDKRFAELEADKNKNE